jgi:hypothetical protein
MRHRLVLALVLAAAVSVQCSGDDDNPTGPDVDPKQDSHMVAEATADLNLVIQTINLWSTRADQALILNEPPWTALLAGIPADSAVRATQLDLVNYYRSKGLRIVVSVDPTNGLNRAADSQPLVDAGRASPIPTFSSSTVRT